MEYDDDNRNHNDDYDDENHDDGDGDESGDDYDYDAVEENLDRVLPVQQGLWQSIDIRW